MYLLYIDESGTSNLNKTNEYSCSNNGNSLFFVLGGILINSKELESIEAQVIEYKNKHLKDPLSELKTTIKNKHMKGPSNKDEFIKGVYSLIANSKSYIFGAQVNKYELYKHNVIASKDDIYQIAFEHLLNAVNNFLVANNIQKNVTVMIDSTDRAHNKKIYKCYKNAVSSRNAKIKSFNDSTFSPSINFVDSEFTVGAQLADFVAGALFRGLERQNKENSRLIRCRFPVDNLGNVIGYSHIQCQNWVQKGIKK